MSVPLRPLHIHPYPPSPEDLEAIKLAKAALELPYKILPIEAAPSFSERILCLRVSLPFLGDHAPVSNPQNPAAMLAALRWVLTGINDPRAITITKQLTKVFGPKLKEVHDGPHFE